MNNIQAAISILQEIGDGIMNYAYINPNDVVNGEGVCVSFWTQGCPHHCQGCFNPETWDFEGGNEVYPDLRGDIIKAICANGIERNFSVLGGEPLCEENKELVWSIVSAVRSAFPHIKIFLWTGYDFKVLKKQSKKDTVVKSILENINTMITGSFVEEKKTLALKWRGSSNQEIWEQVHNKWKKID